MNFGNIIKQGESALAGKDGKIDYLELQKDAKSAYGTYNSTEGSSTDKAKAVYQGYQKDHASESSSESKSESSEKK